VSGAGNIVKALVLVLVGLLAAGIVAGFSLLTAPTIVPPPQPPGATRAHKPAGGVRSGPPRRPPTTPGRLTNTRRAPLDHVSDGGGELLLLVKLLAGTTVLGVLGGCGLVVYVCRRRMRARRERIYARYEIRLSAHDETAPADLEETVEALIGVVRRTLDSRWKDGQPYFAIELHYARAGQGMEWMACLVCEPSVVSQLDGVLTAAYPDVRVGYEFVAEPTPIDGAVREPRYVDRFRKKRLFIYALGRQERDAAGRPVDGMPLMQLIAQAQHSAGKPSTVRMTFTPTVIAMERLAAGLLQHEENRAAREERMGLNEAGLRSEHRRGELRGAQRTQHRGLCWFEVMVASDDAGTCKAVGDALQAGRGENRLHRRTLDLRPQRTRRRFVSGEPPLLPLVWFNWLAPPFSLVLGLRTILSSAEIARLLELPTAATRTVPVRRLMLPRLPAPPELARVHQDAPSIPPSDDRDDDFEESAIEPREHARHEPLVPLTPLTADHRIVYGDHPPLSHRLMPTLQTSNAEIAQHPADRVQGTLVVGGQGSGKTSFLLRSFLNDCRDPNACPILIDPKSEVARLALALLPPDCGKRVWFLNLAYPRFGLSPLWLPPETMRNPRKLAAAVTGVADNIVNSLLDVNEGQIFQASRDVLYHATIGALALAAAHDTRPSFEEINALMSPVHTQARKDVVAAITSLGAPDLEQTREFWDREIPDVLQNAPTLARQQLKAPRNKVGGIVGVPALRRFFNHPVELSLAEIIENRDILIVDAAMGGPEHREGIGEDNSIACIHFLLRMLHTHMQRQIHVAPPLRARVALSLEECHYVVNETTVNMMATHRAAGLEVTLVMQYLAQLMADSSARTEKIRKGVMNLCQSRLLFSIGDPDDAEAAVRGAMAVYDSLIRSDAAARARMRGTPESLINLPSWYCLALLRALGRRMPACIGRTYFMPRGQGHMRTHYQRMVDALGASYPERMGSTYRRSIRRTRGDDVEHARRTPTAPSAERPEPPATPIANEHTVSEPSTAPNEPDVGGQVDEREDGASPGSRASAGSHPPKPVLVRTTQPELWEPVEPERAAEVLGSRVLELVGRPLRDSDYPVVEDGASTPRTLAELAIFDQIRDVKPNDIARLNPLGRYTEKQVAVVLLLDRFDFLTTAQIARALWPADATERTVQKVLARMESAGLLQRTQTFLHNQNPQSSPALWSLTRAGFKLGQQPPSALITSVEPIPEGRRYRASRATKAARVPHDLHVVNWMQAFTALIPAWATTYWRTPRYHTGRFRPPHVGSGRLRRPLRAADIFLGAGYSFAGIPTEDWEEIVPDVCVEVHVVSDPAPRPGRRYDLRFDLLLELDLTERAAYNDDKLRKYDAFLTGWALEHQRIRRLGTRPIVVLTSPNAKRLLTLMRHADKVMRGRIGLLGTPEHEWYYPGRDHVLFAVESDVHHGSLRALKLPALPADVRARLGEESFTLRRVGILPHALLRAATNRQI
jgi:hypothetical protein